MNELLPVTDTAQDRGSGTKPMVRHFRKIVIWPLQIEMPETTTRRKHAELLEKALLRADWKLVEDEFGNPDEPLEERHYREFVSFLPHVQRFLYGDATGPVRQLRYGDAPLRIYRRTDIAAVRIEILRGEAPVVCKVSHIDLHFFYDSDVVILAAEIEADDLPLATAQHIMHRFGRAYPSGWTEAGEPLNTTAKVEWLGRDGKVLAASDYENRVRFLRSVGIERAPCFGAHWEYVLSPMLPTYANANAKGLIRYRQVEYYRMPSMSFLSFDRLDDLSRQDTIKLAFLSGPGALPQSAEFLANFEKQHCYDRFYYPGCEVHETTSRFLVTGHSITMLTSGPASKVEDRERGLLAQFRHQYYLLFLISHFHKASMLLISDQLVAAVKLLEEGSERSAEAFRQKIYRLQENFMRFAQRYYFTDISDQAQARDIFKMQSTALDNERLYGEIRHEIFDLVQYLDSDVLRRQSGTIHRLTAVSTVGLIGTVATGFLGMNLIAAAEQPLDYKLWAFGAVTAVVTVLTALVVVFSRPLTALFDRMGGERKRT